jgi:RNA polymerase sigma-70 factor (ECF subfamily)
MLQMTDDRSLMASIAAGDQESFRVFMQRHMPAIHRFARRHLFQADVAEDVVQEAFTRVWQFAPGWQDQGVPVKSWLYRITYNLCIDVIRKNKPEDDVVDELSVESTPETINMEADRQAKLQQAMNELPENQRMALAMCAYQGLSNREAADAMDVSVEALESLLARARRRLRKQMQAEGLLP